MSDLPQPIFSAAAVVALLAATALIAGVAAFSVVKSGARAGLIRLDAFSSSLLGFLVSSVMLLGIGSAKIFSHAFSDANAAVFSGTAVLQISGIAAALWFARNMGFSLTPAFRPHMITQGILYFTASLSALTLAAAINFAYGAISGEAVAQQEVVSVFVGIDSLPVRALAIFSIAVLAPVVEEVFFRGILYRAGKYWFSGLQRFGKIAPAFASAIAVSILFACVHASLFAFFPIFLMGLILICAYERSGSLAVPIIAHSLFNITNMAILSLR